MRFGIPSVSLGRGLFLAALCALALWVGWIGFIASDDSLYYAGADHWLNEGLWPGDNHWSTRFPLILTFAGVLKVTGRNFIAFATTAIACYAVLIVLIGWFAAHIAGARAGWIAAFLAATLPVIVAHATTVGVDLLEAALLLSGALLLGGADDDSAGLKRGLGAGACFGLAILCRETAILSLVGLGVLFVIGRPVPRRVLLAAGVGIALIIGAEILFQGAMTGDPLRRYTIAFHHDEHIDRAANMEGNFLLWPPIDPLLVLLVNDDFGLLFWLAGLAIGMGAMRGVGADGRRRFWILGAMALASFVLVAILAHKLVLNPRYFTLPALAAIVILAIWLDRMPWRPRAGLIALFTATNLLLLSVGNAHPRWQMESLIAAARAHRGETVHGDPMDVRRARLPMGFLGLANTAYAPARPGRLLIAAANAAPPGAIVARYPSPPTRLGTLLRTIGLEGVVPKAIARRIFAPSPDVVLARVR